MNADLHASVTRIADFENADYDLIERPRTSWETGDYVQVKITERPTPGIKIENTHGRGVELIEGETFVGALGTRRATLDLVGGWQDVTEDRRMNLLSKGGVLGRVTSASPFSYTPMEVDYQGHIELDGSLARMRDFRLTGHASGENTPVILVLGTSMSSGKTMSGRVIIRVLEENGYQVIACKLTGAGAYRDILSMKVAGAEAVYDFVDAGLPTTVVPESTFREAITPVINRGGTADVMVVEIGASPLEPYNGEVVTDLLDDRIVFTVLCASDPYAVVGLETAFGRSPDLVSGIATNTQAGIDLVTQLSSCAALNLQDVDAKEPLRELLVTALDAYRFQ